MIFSSYLLNIYIRLLVFLNLNFNLKFSWTFSLFSNYNIKNIFLELGFSDLWISLRDSSNWWKTKKMRIQNNMKIFIIWRFDMYSILDWKWHYLKFSVSAVSISSSSFLVKFIRRCFKIMQRRLKLSKFITIAHEWGC